MTTTYSECDHGTFGYARREALVIVAFLVGSEKNLVSVAILYQAETQIAKLVPVARKWNPLRGNHC